MTDTLASPTTLNGTHKPLHSHTLADYVHYPPAHIDVTLEDDGQISCFCGLNEDDGNTVACDDCNKWQHIRCYYPQWSESSVPDDLQHFCIDCRPRDLDGPGARVRQMMPRKEKEFQANGTKRPPSKQKKKPREVGQTNGWPVDKHRHDRTSTSPRDQGPPAKRPKTTHRSSNPTASRKRSASTLHKRSTSGSPEMIAQTYSTEFLAAYQNDDYTITRANCLDNLEIGAKLSSWLGNPQEVEEITNGLRLHDIFQRYDGDMDVIDPPIDLIELQETYDDRVKSIDGRPAMWKVAMLKEPLTTHACIGELRGHIGFKEDYKAEPSNRWPVLKHPEPFVFFHPNLPICIDARQEGTIVRYVRRSCDPNAELKVIITGAADYHFCFIAMRDIDAGEEIAIAWDCARTLHEMIGGRKISKEDIDSLQQWISLLLSNCGPCACNRQECLMARFDKRFSDDGERAAVGASKPSKRKKDVQHISPLTTHAVNSRSGSEARRFDAEDDGDSGSASGSAGKGSDSRDITPNTHYSANGSHMPELSERERKKLAKEEEMFRRQEEQAMGKQTKKKRTSGGGSINNLTIPTSATAKQSPALPKRMDSANGKQSVPQTNKPRRPKSATSAKTQPVVKRSQSAYVDAAVQCDLDQRETLAHVRRSLVIMRRRVAPLHQRLLERCAQSNALWTENSSRRVRRFSTRSINQDGDTTMADDIPSAGSSSPVQPETISSSQEATADPVMLEQPSSDHTVESPPSVNPTAMKLDMPPPELNAFAWSPTASAKTGGMIGSMVQSPASTGPSALLSPSVQASLGPSTPAKKKLSLSDYTRRSKAKETEIKPDGEGSPGSTMGVPTTTAAAMEDTPRDLDAIMEDVAADAVDAAAL